MFFFAFIQFRAIYLTSISDQEITQVKEDSHMFSPKEVLSP